MKYRVKAGYIDLFYGAASDEYIAECQANGIPQEDIDDMVAEYGDGIYDELEEIEMTNRWYAVMKDRQDDDWGYGSFDLEEAKQMVSEYPDGYIAVIENDVCIEEI